jgi:hypothetical protein
MPAVGFCLLMGFLHYKLVEEKTKKVLSILRNKKSTTSAPVMNEQAIPVPIEK